MKTYIIVYYKLIKGVPDYSVLSLEAISACSAEEQFINIFQSKGLFLEKVIRTDYIPSFSYETLNFLSQS